MTPKELLRLRFDHRAPARTRTFCHTCRTLATFDNFSFGQSSQSGNRKEVRGQGQIDDVSVHSTATATKKTVRVREKLTRPLVRGAKQDFLAGYGRYGGSEKLDPKLQREQKLKLPHGPTSKTTTATAGLLTSDPDPGSRSEYHPSACPQVPDASNIAIAVDTDTAPVRSSTTTTPIKFIGLDLESALSRIFQTKLPIYRSPTSLFTLRAYPSHHLPPRRPPPFPVDLSARVNHPGPCVYLAVVSSKAQVGKLAVERNRCRRRMRAVLEGVVEGRLGIGNCSELERRELVTPEYAYIASVTAELYNAPQDQIVSDVIAALKHLKRIQPRRLALDARLPEPRYLISDQ